MQDFLYYKLQLFSGVIFFIQAFILFTGQIKGRITASPYTFFSVFLILHSVTLFTELFLSFHVQSELVNRNVLIYLSCLNALSLLSLSAAIWQVMSVQYSVVNRPIYQISFSLITILIVFVSGLNQVSLQYKFIFLLWFIYAVSLWQGHKYSLYSSAKEKSVIYGKGIAIAVALAAFSEFFPKTSLFHSIYSLVTGLAMIVVFIHHFQMRDKLIKETDFQQLNQQIQALHLKNLGEWSAALAHEVKTPLHSALLSSDIALRQIPKEHQAYANMLRAKTSISRAIEVSEGVLNYARSTKTSHQSVSIEQSLNSVINLLAFRLRDFKVETYIPENFSVWGDDFLLQSVWTNLLTNAIDACDEADKHIVVQVYSEEDNVHVQIIDSGKADELALNQIEKPFFTTKKAQGGVGLGLSIVNTILQSHQGQMFFYRQKNGTCAHVVLPRLGTNHE